MRMSAMEMTHLLRPLLNPYGMYLLIFDLPSSVSRVTYTLKDPEGNILVLGANSPLLAWRDIERAFFEWLERITDPKNG